MTKSNAKKDNSEKVTEKRRPNPEIAKLEDMLCGWLDGSGPASDIIISSRVRLARNLQNYKFPSMAGQEQLKEVRKKIEEAAKLTTSLKSALYISMEDAPELDKRFLMERRLISPQFSESNETGSLLVDKKQYLGVMINEEDHLRLQNVQSGLQIEKAWDEVNLLDEELSRHLPYAFSEQFGYLTACPTNTGTGMRVSIFIHLPALAITDQLEKVVKEMSPSEITVRGFHGEGTGVQGNIFQISNQLTLGRTEEKIVKRLKIVAERFVELEREEREKFMNTSARRVMDLVHRARAIINNALLLSSFEFIHLLSAIRLGSDLEIIDPIETRRLNELLVIMQPAHLQKKVKKKLKSDERDAWRAQFVKECLKL